jgi:tripartite-type tricarboxylate transporter receptor subunit TctC
MTKTVLLHVPYKGGSPAIVDLVAGNAQCAFPSPSTSAVFIEQGKLRPHIAMFVGTKAVRDLGTPISPDTELMIVAALSGG